MRHQYSLESEGSIYLVILPARDRLPTPTHVVITVNFEHIGKQIIRFNNEVLDHRIEVRIGHFDPRNRDITDIGKDLGEDDFQEIFTQILGDRDLAIFRDTNVLEQLFDGFRKGTVLHILVKLIGQEFDLVEDAVHMALVALTQEETALLVQIVPLDLGLFAGDEALLLQRLSEISVHLLEPSPEHSILIRVMIDVGE